MSIPLTPEKHEELAGYLLDAYGVADGQGAWIVPCSAQAAPQNEATVARVAVHTAA
ncbi:MAG: hypothetical protein ACYTEX_28610 [Planctomycetota bacterium]|jgi:hypothetical protein